MIKVLDVSLMSSEIYRLHKNIIPFLREPWWLITPGYTRYHTCCVDKKGNIDEGDCFHVAKEIGVRPYIHIEGIDSSFSVGDKIKIFDCVCTIIEKFEDEGYVLCDKIVGYSRFHKDKNNWEKSDAKLFLLKWLEEKQTKKHYAVVCDWANDDMCEYGFDIIGIEHSFNEAKKILSKAVIKEKKIANEKNWEIYTDSTEEFNAGKNGSYNVDHIYVYIKEI